jgi:hypothetical protein
MADSIYSMLKGCSLSGKGYSTTANGNGASSNGTATKTRSLNDYFPAGIQLNDLAIYTEAMEALFKVLVSLPGLRRAPGVQGQLKSVPSVVWNGQVGRDQEMVEEGQAMYMTSDRSSLWPVPTTMNIVWDSE